MTLKTLAAAALILAVCGLALGAILMRLRKPLCGRLASMGGIFDFGARVKGVFPPYVEGMCGAFCMRYRLTPAKNLKSIAGAQVVAPVDSKVSWVFTKQDIEEGGAAEFAAALEPFKQLAALPGFVKISMGKSRLTVHFSVKEAGGEKALLDPKVIRQGVVLTGAAARKLGCLARL